MFTNAKISLSEIMSQTFLFGSEIQLVRNCEFAFAAKIPNNLPFRLVSVTNNSHLRELAAADGVSGVLTTDEMVSEIPSQYGLAICKSPYIMLMNIHEHLVQIPDFQWQDFLSEIDPTAQIHPSATIAEKNVRVGHSCVIGPNVVICERVIIGTGCSIGPNSVIGCDAYDLKAGSSPPRLLKQSGGVKIGNDVTILASTMIVKATFGGFTTIEDGASFDNMVHIAHDCHIGKRVKIAACAELSGRVNVGDDCFLGPNITVSNGLTIGERSTITLGSVVVKDVEPDTRVTGNFALPHNKWIRFIKSIR